MRASLPSFAETDVGQTPPQPHVTPAEAVVHLGEDGERRFLERLAELLQRISSPPPVPPRVRVIDVRRPSFLLQGGCLVQVEVVYPDKTMVFWCLFFDGETDAVVEPFLNREKSIQDVIERVERARGTECIRIDRETVRDYVMEFINYELAYAGEAGLLVNDLEPNSRTFGVLDWPTPLLETEKLEVEACLSTHRMRVDRDTDHSLRVEACMLERDALVWCAFRVFTKDNSSSNVDPGKKGLVVVTEAGRSSQVLVSDLPDNCRAKPGASLGIPRERFAADSEGWELVLPEDALSIRSDLDRLIKPKVRFDGGPEELELVLPMDGLPICSNLDQPYSTQSVVWSRQHLACYDLDLLKIEPRNSDERWIAYIVREPGFALPLPLNSEATPIHDFNRRLAKHRSKSKDKRVIRTKEGAADYAVFFGRHVWGPEGPFMVLKSKDDTAIGRLDLKTHGKLETNEYDSIDLALAAIAEPKATESSDKQAFEVVDAWVLYGETIFKATFSVQADGLIKMTKDEPMVSARVKDTARVIEDTARVKHNAYPACVDLECVISEAAEPTPLAALELKTKSGPLEDRVLTGELTQETLQVRLFRRCRFRGRVNLQFLVSDRLSFEECVFENGLDLSGASLKGTLSMKRCLMTGRHHPRTDTAPPLSFDGLSADSLRIDGLWSTGSLSASRVRIDGAVKLSKMATLGGIDLTGLAAQSLELFDAYTKTDIELQKCVIEQSVDFRDVQTGKDVNGSSIGLYGAVIKYNYVGFRDVTLTGDLSANFLRVGTGFFLKSDAPRGNTIDGSIELGGADLPKVLRIRNTRVGKSIEAKAVATGEVQILGGRLQPEAAVGEFKTSQIGGFIDLTDADIQHDVTLVDLAVGTDPHGANTNKSLLLRNAEVGGSVRFFQAEANDKPDYSGEWQHGLDLKNATILGDVDLSGVQCPAGGICLEEAEIQRDLHIKAGSKRATANYLAMTGLKCQGEADITGLELSGKPTAKSEDGAGAVIANLATFANKLIVAKLAESVERSAEIPGRLDLSGSTIGELAVSYSSFPLKPDDKNLTVDDKKEPVDRALTVGDQKKQDDKTLTVEYLDDKNLMTYGIILNRARVDKLSVFRTRSEPGCQYPQPIDLRYSEIKWWEFRDGNDSKSDDAQDYVDLLKGDRHLQRHTFSSIEQNLFNRGLDDAADEVHRAMRKWLRADATPKLGRWLKNRFRSVWDLLALCGSWLKNRFRWLRNPFRSVWGSLTLLGRWLRNCLRSVLDLLTLSTTSPWPLFLIVVFWTLLSVFGVFSNPANIGPSEAALIAHPEWRGVRVQPDAEWDRLAGVWMAVRFHVPVVTFTAWGAWKPANARELTVSLPYLSWRTARLSPEDYANFVLALHFLIWPVILIIASRKFFLRLGKGK